MKYERVGRHRSELHGWEQSTIKGNLNYSWHYFIFPNIEKYNLERVFFILKKKSLVSHHKSFLDAHFLCLLVKTKKTHFLCFISNNICDLQICNRYGDWEFLREQGILSSVLIMLLLLAIIGITIVRCLVIYSGQTNISILTWFMRPFSSFPFTRWGNWKISVSKKVILMSSKIWQNFTIA